MLTVLVSVIAEERLRLLVNSLLEFLDRDPVPAVQELVDVDHPRGEIEVFGGGEFAFYGHIDQVDVSATEYGTGEYMVVVKYDGHRALDAVLPVFVMEEYEWRCVYSSDAVERLEEEVEHLEARLQAFTPATPTPPPAPAKKAPAKKKR